VELLYGSRPVDAHETYPALDLAETADVVLENVSIGYSLFETPLAAAIPLLQSGVHPSVPPLIVATFWSVPGGPLGAFEFASIGISCRTGIKPRQLIYSAFIDNDRAGAALARRYGYRCQPAKVKLREFYDRITGSVVINERELLQLDTTGMVPLVGAGSFVKFSPALNFIASSHDQSQLAQFEASYDFVRVIRGAPRLLEFDAAALGHPGLNPRHPVSGAFAVVNLTLHPVKFLVSATVPAEAGGVTRIERPQREYA
jgi:hypothetical protein